MDVLGHRARTVGPLAVWPFVVASAVVALAVVACGPAASSSDPATGSSGTATSTVDPSPDDGVTSSEGGGMPSTSTGAAGSSSDSSPPGDCGNGQVDPAERCDGPDCSEDCQVPVRLCRQDPRPHVCGNAIDDDGDGLVDLFDPDCLNPCDDAEDALATLFPVNSDGPWAGDCYWDDNRGSGDDGCVRDLTCDPSSPGAPCETYVAGTRCDAVSAQCEQQCGPMVPNGCDCFGCCMIDGAPVFLGFSSTGCEQPTCSADALAGCGSCTIEPDCFNPCDGDACELCLLDDETDLAPGCAAPACPDGVDSCANAYDDCPVDATCLGGCCLPFAVPA